MRRKTSVRTSFGIALMLAAAGADALAAQTRVVRRKSKPKGAANELIRWLELDERRGDALVKLRARGRESVPDLIGAIEDPRRPVRLAAIAALAAIGTEAEAAVMALERLTRGEDTELARAAQWALIRVRRIDRYVIADYTGSRLVETDLAGKPQGTIPGLSGIWSAKRVPGGNYLVTEYASDKVREITPAGEEVWSVDASSPLDAVRLMNGHTLAALWHGGKLIEIDTGGKIVWELDGIQAVDVDVLVDGHYLVTTREPNRVFEVGRDKKIRWQLDLDDEAIDADRLPNGNTLITFDKINAIREFMPAGDVVAELKVETSPEDAERLPDGSTLVCCQGGVRVLDRNGEEIQKITFAQTGDVERY